MLLPNTHVYMCVHVQYVCVRVSVFHEVQFFVVGFVVYN